MNKQFDQWLKENNNIPVAKNISLTNKSTLQIGGMASYYYQGSDKEDLQKLFVAAKECDLEIEILGRGSNVLIKQGLIPKLILSPILTQTQNNDFLIKDESIYFKAGVSISSAIKIAQKNRLYGLECLVGIPGSIGGAVKMNAGTKQGELAGLIDEVEWINSQGLIESKKADEIKWDYRRTSIDDESMVLSVKVALKYLPLSAGKERIKWMKEYLNYRNKTQPLNKPNLGSTFVNPSGHYAARLIEETGLKGFRIGQVAISKHHANFLENLGEASDADVLNIVSEVKDKVWQKHSVKLIPEIRLLGFEEKNLL